MLDYENLGNGFFDNSVSVIFRCSYDSNVVGETVPAAQRANMFSGKCLAFGIQNDER